MEDLITREQLARRWHCSKEAVADREAAGMLRRVGSEYGEPPGILYRVNDVIRLETGEDASPMSKKDRDDYEREIAALKEDRRALIAYIQSTMSNAQMTLSEIFQNTGGYL